MKNEECRMENEEAKAKYEFVRLTWELLLLLPFSILHSSFSISISNSWCLRGQTTVRSMGYSLRTSATVCASVGRIIFVMANSTAGVEPGIAYSTTRLCTPATARERMALAPICS